MAEQVNVRNLVIDILLAVTRDGEFSHIAIRNVLDKYRYLPRQDRAFLTRVSEGTIERMIEMDYLIDRVSKTKVNKMKPVIRAILRSGVYQLKYMDSVPASAACNEAVKLAAKRGFSGLKGFVNGVMRSVARGLENGQLVLPDREKEPEQYLSVTYSTPMWLTKRFLKQFGMEQTEHMLQMFLLPGQTSVRLNTGRMSAEGFLSSMQEQGISVVPNPLLPYAFFISGYEALDEIPEFGEGLFYIQNTSSMMVAEIAEPEQGDFVLDVCAAPGGKSVHIAEKLCGTGMVEARDLTEYKVELIEENIERCQLKNMRAKVWDATVWDSQMEQKADVVIADLPCSGLGVIGTKTDIKYNASEQKIADLAKLQGEILDVVSGYVKPGGTLVFSTCTITEEENGQNTARFSEAHPDFSLTYEHQILPEAGEDGFYIAKWKKTK